MWDHYLHHITVHFPIIGSFGLAAIACVYIAKDELSYERLLRFGGWVVAIVSTVTVVSGVLMAPGWFGGDGPLELTHHRNMGIAAYVTILTAAIGFEIGLRQPKPYAKRFSALLWVAIAFGCVGAGHWGGSVVHSDIIPWDGSAPVIKETVETTSND